MQFTNNRKTTESGNPPSNNVDLIPKGPVKPMARPVGQGDRIGAEKKKAEMYNKLGALLLKNQKWDEAVEAYENGKESMEVFSTSQ